MTCVNSTRFYPFLLCKENEYQNLVKLTRLGSGDVGDGDGDGGGGDGGVDEDDDGDSDDGIYRRIRVFVDMHIFRYRSTCLYMRKNLKGEYLSVPIRIFISRYIEIYIYISMNENMNIYIYISSKFTETLRMRTKFSYMNFERKNMISLEIFKIFRKGFFF